MTMQDQEPRQITLDDLFLTIERLRAAGDALAARVRDNGYATDMERAALAQWQEVRRGS